MSGTSGSDAGAASVLAFQEEPSVTRIERRGIVIECSRWPERQDCGQECLKQIEISPENCLVWNIVSNWYDGKQCIFCHKKFGKLQHLDHAPALLGPDHETVEWRNLRPEQLPEVFSTHRPVCWTCHVTETFRRLHPELVVNRELEPKRIM